MQPLETFQTNPAGAAVVGIVCMHRELDYADALSVGLYLQTLMLSLTARGLGTCAQVSLATYPDPIEKNVLFLDDHELAKTN